jgi:hypothetical protein
LGRNATHAFFRFLQSHLTIIAIAHEVIPIVVFDLTPRRSIIQMYRATPFDQDRQELRLSNCRVEKEMPTLEEIAEYIHEEMKESVPPPIL